MAEELLDRPQVGAALQQMGGEGVAEPVWVGEEAPQRGRVQRAPAGGEEERVLRAARQLGPAALELDAQTIGRLLAERDDALLAALAAYVHELLLEVDVGEPEIDGLLGAEPGRVDKLEERTVAEAEGVVRLDAGKQGVRLGGPGRVRKAAAATAGDRQVRDTARAECRAQERADGRQLASHRRLRELAGLPSRTVGAELGCVGGERTGVEALESQVVAAEPRGQLVEVAPVGAPRGVGERLAPQKAVDGGARVHDAGFRLARSAPSSNAALLLRREHRRVIAGEKQACIAWRGTRLPAVVLRHRVRDLVLASWETDADRVARVLPAGLDPATVDGRHLVTVAALRWAGGRLGVLPVPRFSQVNVRVYARHRDETAVVFLAQRVSLLGMGGALLGFPVRPVRARVR